MWGIHDTHWIYPRSERPPLERAARWGKAVLAARGGLSSACQPPPPFDGSFGKDDTQPGRLRNGESSPFGKGAGANVNQAAFSRFNSTFEFRPLCSYFSRRTGGIRTERPKFEGAVE